METQISRLLITSVFIVAVTVLIKVLNWVWLKPNKLEKYLRQQGLEGTSYKFLFGDLKLNSMMHSQAYKQPMSTFSHDYLPRVEPLFHQLATQFGRCYFVWSGPTPMLKISKPELVIEALTKMQQFRKPNLNPLAEKLFPGFINYEGEKWAKHRKMVNPAFHVEKLKLMLPAFQQSCVEMIDKWEKVVAETGSSELDVWPYLTTLTADVISRAAFGSSYKEGQKIFELLKEQTDIGVQMLRAVYIPGMRYIPTARNRRFKEVEHCLQTLLKKVVNKRKEQLETGEVTQTDLLGILLDSNSKKIQQGAGNLGLSLQEVINECKLFYFAGQETTSALLVWTLILLSKYQEWQNQAREEVLQTFGENAPEFEGLSNLKTVTMILYEVLRLYSPATQLSRRLYRNTKLGDLSLPAGALVTFPISFIHRDKEIWGDDAEEFRPDRFSEGISKAANGNKAFFPFGWGPRICIGEKFGMTETKLAISMILQRFSLELSPSYTHAPMTIVFLQPQHGAQIIFHKI